MMDRARSTPHSRRAITLIETVISLSIMSILLLGLSGAVIISSKAIPTTAQTGAEDQIVINAFNQFRSDLRQATLINFASSGSEKKLTLKIKDSGANGNPTEIRYRYIVASNSFARMVKGRTEETLFNNISAFAIQFAQEGNDATVLRVLISAPNTIQNLFELHIALPDKPELK